MWAVLSVNNIIYFYMLIEVSIVYFIYLFIYRAYKERTTSLILIITYMLIFRLPFLIIILNIQTTNILLIKINNTSIMIFLIIVIIFINKIPLYGFHYWLLKAHSYCTTWGSVILARIMLKVGVLGFIYIYQVSYININIFKYYIYLGIIISRFNILYITDIKIIIAQTRVTHISFLGISLLINNNIRIKLSVIFCYIHGIIRSIIFAFAEMLMTYNKSRNIILLKQLYVIRFIFMTIILINNSFPITPYMWCELWIFIMIRRNILRYIPIIIVIVLTCNLLFFNWLILIKHQYIIIISDIKYSYIIMYLLFSLILFFILIK